MELEFFCEPGTDEEWQQYWIDYRKCMACRLRIAEGTWREYEHPKESCTTPSASLT